MKFKTWPGIIYSREMATRKAPNGHFYRDDLPDGVGNFTQYWGGNTIFFFMCPCGCKLANQLAVYKGEKGHGWKWNGDRQRPTLHPSIAQTSRCGWHGHLVQGEWVKSPP